LTVCGISLTVSGSRAMPVEASFGLSGALPVTEIFGSAPPTAVAGGTSLVACATGCAV